MGQSLQIRNFLIRVAFIITVGLKMNYADDPFGPEPKDISDATGDGVYAAVFRYLAKYAAHTTDINVWVPFQFDKFASDLYIQSEHIKNFVANIDLRFRAPAEQMVQIHRQGLRDSQVKLSDHMSVLPNKDRTKNPSRQKRFLGLVLAAASLGLSSYNSVQIAHMEHEMSQLKTKTDLMVKVQHLQENHLKHQDERLDRAEEFLLAMSHSNLPLLGKICDYVESHHEQTVDMVGQIIASAMQHRLAPGAIHIDALRAIVKHSKDVAKERGLINFITSPSDLYNIPVSSVWHPFEQKFVLILHIPLVNPTNMMDLKQYIPLPLIHNSTANFTLTADPGAHDLIAIGNTKLFKTMPSAELANCLHLGETFFCKGRRELRTDIDQDCLAALHFGTTAHIKEQCQFRITKTKEMVFEITENSWIVYTTGSFVTDQRCPGQQTKSLRIDSGKLVQVNAGCSVRTKQHVLVADDSITQTIDPKADDWNWALEHLFPEHQPEAVLKAIDTLHQKGSHSIDATDLFNQIDALNQPDGHWTFSFPVLITVSALLIVALIAGIRCLRKAGTPAPVIVPATAPELAQVSVPPAYTQKPEVTRMIPVNITYA